MSMLAERKRKTKWVINPTKKPIWTTDSEGLKYGKKLMEKMGWSAGKGLGAQEQGIQEPLKVSYKNDTQGMGFKENEENWIEHQDEFNKLLNQLRNSNDCIEDKLVEKKSGIQSLEEKSKQSKVRVHYHKFTRGKDLSRYSENDLSCILGTTKIKKEGSKNEEKAQKNAYDKSFGVTTINSGSIQDYFKKKWNLGKSKTRKINENGYNNEESNLKFNSENQIKSDERNPNFELFLSEENSQYTDINEMKDTSRKSDKKSKKRKKKNSIEENELLSDGDKISKMKKVTDEKDYTKYKNANNDLNEEKENSLDVVIATKDNLSDGNNFKKYIKSNKKLKEKHITQTDPELEKFEKKVTTADSKNTNDISVTSKSLLEGTDVVEEAKENKKKKHKRKLSENIEVNDLTGKNENIVDSESNNAVDSSEIILEKKHKKKAKLKSQEKIQKKGSYFEEINCDSVNVLNSNLEKSECVVDVENLKQTKKSKKSKEKIFDSSDQKGFLSQKCEETITQDTTVFKTETEKAFTSDVENCFIEKEKKKKKKHKEKSEKEEKINEKKSNSADLIIENSGSSSIDSISEKKKCKKSKKRNKENSEIFEESDNKDCNKKNEKDKKKRKKNSEDENTETHRGKVSKCEIEKNVDKESVKVNESKAVNINYSETMRSESKINTENETKNNGNEININNLNVSPTEIKKTKKKKLNKYEEDGEESIRKKNSNDVKTITVNDDVSKCVMDNRNDQNFKFSKNHEDKKGTMQFIEPKKPEQEQGGVIFTHKAVNFKKKKSISGLSKNINYNTVLNLICGADMSKFNGSNLFDVPGYGIK